MPSPKWRSSLPTRRVTTRFQKDPRIQYGLIGAALALCFVFIGSTLHGTLSPPFLTARELAFDNPPPVHLFIAIGSAPGNARLRDAARQSWLKWTPNDSSVSYRFFTDAPPNGAELADADRQTWKSLAAEAADHRDLVQQTLDSGYGDKEHNAYGMRARFQTKWAMNNFRNLSYFLRIDDDSFLCLHKLLYELKSAPREQFFWGRYWCRQFRNRADESFMLFSSDVAKLVADDTYMGKLIPFDNSVTFGWNFGYLSWILNLTVFDDQARIDSQQGYLTNYMHNEAEAGRSDLSAFCENYIYAHHVQPTTMVSTFKATKTHLMYTLPNRKPPTDTCPRLTQSFLPAKHSARLPDLLIDRSSPA